VDEKAEKLVAKRDESFKESSPEFWIMLAYWRSTSEHEKRRLRNEIMLLLCDW